MRREVTLPPDAAGRLDRALADALGAGRAAVKAAFAAGEVRVAGRRVRASAPAAPGLVVTVELADVPGRPVAERSVPLAVLAEGPSWLVADKPAGVATHPLRAGETGTLANAVAAHHPECTSASPDPRDGGALQRLDLETSGCVLFARTRAGWEALRAQLAGRTVEKRYRALVAGRVAGGGVSSVMLAQRGARVVAVPEPERAPRSTGKPRPAETHWEVERAFPAHTLLAVRIVTGVMHQIRAHLAHAGHPVAGDLLYGGAAAALPGLGRHFLHAAALGFERPEGGRVRVESPLPPELEAVLARLGDDG
jgi:23S rRNA pseudouridine1911/1915/1917 synthase